MAAAAPAAAPSAVELFSQELRTPPLALVAMLGRPDLHAQVGDFLRSEHRPPLNSIGVSEFTSATRLFGARKVAQLAARGGAAPPVVGGVTMTFSLPPAGILKSDWLAKHRQRRPAVAVAFFDRDAVCGDPTSWTKVCGQLDVVRAATKLCNAKMVIVVASHGVVGEVPEERAAILRRRCEVDAKCVVPLDAADPAPSLRRLGAVLYELCQAFYQEEGRRVLGRLSALRESGMSVPLEIGGRYCFKVAAFSEFRQDWSTALKYYGNAYSHLVELARIHGSSAAAVGAESTDVVRPAPVQKWAELRTVAEELMFKLLTLLLHAGALKDAGAQFRGHIKAFRDPPSALVPPGAAAAHEAWVSRQYQVFGELLQTRLQPAALAALGRDLHPSHHFHLAAVHAIRRREAAAAAPAVAVGEAPALVPGAYVGQRAPLAGAGPVAGAAAGRVTDDLFVGQLAAAESAVAHSAVALDLLTKSHAMYKAIRAGRAIYHLGSLMAREYTLVGDHSSARRLLESVAAVYRKEGWEDLLAATLGDLAACGRALGLTRELAEWELELSALAVCPGGGEGRAAAYRAALPLLAVGPAPPPTPGGGAGAEHCYDVAEGGGLAGALAAECGFSRAAVSLGRRLQRGSPLVFAVALHSGLPEALPISRLEARFSDPSCCCSLPAWEGQARQGGEGAGVAEGAEGAAEALEGLSLGGGGGTAALRTASSLGPPLDVPPSSPLVLQPGRWGKFFFSVRPAAPGALRCTEVVAWVGPSTCFRFPLPAPPAPEAGAAPLAAPRAAALAGAGGAGGRRAFAEADGIASGVHEVEVTDREPRAAVALKAAPPALVGELFPVTVALTSSGDSLARPSLAVTLRAPAAPAPAPATDALAEGAAAAEGAEAEAEGAGAGAWPPGVELFQEKDGALVPLSPGGHISFPDLPKRASHQVRVFLRAVGPGGVVVDAKVTYGAGAMAGAAAVAAAGAGEGAAALLPSTLEVPFAAPFSLEHRVCTRPRRHVLLPQLPAGAGGEGALPVGEPATVKATLRLHAPLDIRVLGARLVPDPEAKGLELLSAPTGCSGALAGGGEVMAPGEEITELFEVRQAGAGGGAGGRQPLGHVEVRWERAHAVLGGEGGEECGGAADGVVTTVLPLGSAPVAAPVLVASWSPPPEAVAGVPFVASLLVQNETDAVQQVQLEATEAAAFVFSGEKSGGATLLPRGAHAFRFCLVAVAAGLQELPEVRVTCPAVGALLALPEASRALYVLPAPAAKAAAAA